MFETIGLEKKDGIAVLTIRRPEALNALNGQVLEEMKQCVDEVQQDSEIRALQEKDEPLSPGRTLALRANWM